MPEYRFCVPMEWDGALVRRAAMGGLKLSSGQFKRAKFHGQILLDGIAVRADAHVRAGQELCILVPEVENTQPEPVSIPFEILYEDEYFWMVDKPVAARRPGWPLDSLSMEFDETSFMEEGVELKPSLTGEARRAWITFLATELGLAPLEAK